ncbi:hypothetical protein KSC_095770 [Ktedonobacter sp. SOSP1-52]|uniref:DedA family protein n=1 Tax=Ktedonobacter sp. SOSP1-52 TaxID=2778366 RepID=UPI001915AC56|nr:DedA family protein [Ktedonobacter sp. SOSP1-52]GHO70685.1 hypothetical protein KSC_095770 [Ktedonobacter sp. SOSP1-52]
MLQTFIEWLKLFYDQYGYLIVFLSTLSENTALLGLVMPGNSLALLGAFYARLGTLNLGLVILFATLGTVAGYHIDYLLGRFALGGPLQRFSATRLGIRMRFGARMRLARLMLHKHGGKAIILSHVAGHLRSFVAISAGLTRMRYTRFLFFEVIAALLWNTIYSLVGYFIAVEIDTLETIFQRMGLVIIALALVLFGAWYMWRRRKRQQRHQRRLARLQARMQA